MKPKFSFRARAVALRKQGKSYREIRQSMKIAKSTLSNWLKDVPLKDKDKQRLYTKQIHKLALGASSQKERRLREIDLIVSRASNEVNLPLSFETMRLVGAALYWAEGSKGRRIELTNSDPLMILFMIHWLKIMFGILPEKLTARLNIYSQQNEGEIKKFWSELTRIPLSNFKKSYVKPVSKNHKKNNLYYGTVRIEVPKSTDLSYYISGWIKGMLKNLPDEARLVQLKWKKLANTARPVNLL